MFVLTDRGRRRLERLEEILIEDITGPRGVRDTMKGGVVERWRRRFLLALWNVEDTGEFTRDHITEDLVRDGCIKEV